MDGSVAYGEIAAAVAGDRDAVRAVWLAHRRWVAAVLLAYKPRDADLEDLLQTVAVQLVRRIDTLEDPAAFKPWLRAVAINAARADARTRRRKGRGRFRLVGTPERADVPSGPDAGTCEEARRLLELAMTLPEGYREPLLLRCVRGLSYRQIAELLDLPETTIETRIARGRRMLREMATSGAGDASRSKAPAAR